MRHNFAKLRSKKRHSIIQKIFWPPQPFLLHFYALIFFRCKIFHLKKISTSEQFLNFVPTSYYSVPCTLKNAPLWNFLRHQCLKCAHMSTIALTIRHTGLVDFLNLSNCRQKPAKTAQDSCRSAVDYTFVEKVFDLFMNICENTCQIWVSWPQIPVYWHQASPIRVKLKPRPPNCCLLWGHFSFEVVRLRRECLLSFSVARTFLSEIADFSTIYRQIRQVFGPKSRKIRQFLAPFINYIYPPPKKF